jgi:CRP/FNR family transcriptional regulator
MIDSEVLSRLNIPPGDLQEVIRDNGKLLSVPAGTEILRAGQYVKVIPIVVKGMLKVFSRHEGKELLLYYIRPKESCIMSFTAGLQEEPSKIYALAEEDTEMVALPTSNLGQWIRKYPALNELFLAQYSMRYQELLVSLNHLLFDSLEDKVLRYLQKQQALREQDRIKVTHKTIAGDLATSREVVSRIIKKLENAGLINISDDGIAVIKT